MGPGKKGRRRAKRVCMHTVRLENLKREGRDTLVLLGHRSEAVGAARDGACIVPLVARDSTTSR